MSRAEDRYWYSHIAKHLDIFTKLGGEWQSRLVDKYDLNEADIMARTSVHYSSLCLLCLRLLSSSVTSYNIHV